MLRFSFLPHFPPFSSLSGRQSGTGLVREFNGRFLTITAFRSLRILHFFVRFFFADALLIVCRGMAYFRSGTFKA
jgi:hypothetical protein